MQARLLITAAAAVVSASPAAADDLAGTTWTVAGGSARVAFAEEDEMLVGRIIWLAEEEQSGEPTLDRANPDAALQSRPLNGVAMAWGFEQIRDDLWDRGRVYAPDDGKTYNAKMRLEGDVLTLTGCIRWPLCRDSEWTRYEMEETAAAEE